MHFEKKIMCVSYKIVLPHDRSTKTNCVDSKFHVSDIEIKIEQQVYSKQNFIIHFK